MSEAVAAPAPISAPPIAAPATDPATPLETAAPEPKFKVKVDGKEEEVPLAELQKHYGTFKASQKAMQESAELRKQAEEAIGYLKKGTREALRAAGLTPDQIRTIAIEQLSEEHQALLEEERKRGLSAEQRELEDARVKLKAADAEKAEREKVVQAGKTAEAKQRITGAVIETLEQFPESVRRNEMLANQVFHAWAYVLEHPDEAKKLGIEATPAGIHKALLKRQRELVREMMTHEKDEDLDAYLAPTVKGRLFKTQKAAAEASAHPSLTGKSETRSAPIQPGPTKKGSQTLRSLTLGAIGMKQG